MEIAVTFITAAACINSAFCFFAVPARRTFLRRIKFFSFDDFYAVSFSFIFDVMIDFSETPVG
ncbi:hypothetical protein J22TS1_41020 [Siminovitchia terrae]|nr:hypothetical protein J22TS1_41020 [Siminovitchia terrae]